MVRRLDCFPKKQIIEALHVRRSLRERDHARPGEQRGDEDDPRKKSSVAY
jgi:hypothetical protein